jgi:hypothetical protein
VNTSCNLLFYNDLIFTAIVFAMGRIFDFAGVLRDFKHSFTLPAEKRSDGELSKQ